MISGVLGHGGAVIGGLGSVWSRWFPNPKGIVPQSPRLARSAYLGLAWIGISTPKELRRLGCAGGAGVDLTGLGISWLLWGGGVA